jgi:dienelactone hydrolase
MYPGCQIKFLEDTARSPGPLLILGGSADDYTPVSYCRAYVERLQGAGNDVRLVELPGATHCFDCDAFPKPHKLDGAVTLGACRLEETQPGVVTNLDTGKPFSRTDACAGRSPTIVYDADAYARALGEIQQLVRSAFHLAH